MVEVRQTGTIIVDAHPDQSAQLLGDVMQIFTDKDPLTGEYAREIRRAAVIASEAKRIYVVAHKYREVSEAAQNVLLKTLEDGTAGVYIVFIVPNVGKLLKTVVSRCEVQKFTVVDQEVADEHMMFARNDSKLALILKSDPKEFEEAKQQLALAKSFLAGPAKNRIEIIQKHSELQQTVRLIHDLLYVSSFAQINGTSVRSLHGSRTKLADLQEAVSTVGSSLKLVHSQLILL